MYTTEKQPSYNRDIGKFEGGIHKSLGQDSFNFITLKGQGAFGKVYKVSLPRIRSSRCTNPSAVVPVAAETTGRLCAFGRRSD